MNDQQQYPPHPDSAVPPAMPAGPEQHQIPYFAPPPTEEAPPAMPPRPEQQPEYYAPPPSAGESLAPALPSRPAYDQSHNPVESGHEQGDWPAYNPKDFEHKPTAQEAWPAYNPRDYENQPVAQDQGHLYPPPPPKRTTKRYSDEQDVSSPIHYTRDPKKLIAYLVPFPRPHVPNIPPENIPQRFLIYTPPPPPFVDKVPEGQKEGKVHMAQRKWQEEIREAKTSTAKTMSWKGVKSKAVKGINWGMGQTKSSNLEFLNRIGGSQPQEKTEGEQTEGNESVPTVKLEEMILVYPSSMPGSPETIREEFVNTMLRSKSKAQRDAVIATGLLPVSAAIDILLTFVWPFGGLLEIDSVWAYASIRGAKASRSVTKRLASTGRPDNDKDVLHLNFSPSPRLAVLEQFLASRCHERDAQMFPAAPVVAPSESEVLEAIGWFPSSKGGAERNWEDEQWEISEVKDDLRGVMGKGAKEWVKWCRLFEKEPEKAMKK